MSTLLPAIRAWMKQETIDVMLISCNDEFQNEYPPLHEEWLRRVTGYADVWGFAIITADESLLFVPAKGFGSVEHDVDQTVWTIHDSIQLKPTQWLKDNLQKDQIVALESIRFTVREAQSLQKVVKLRQAHLRELATDVASLFWTDRPLPATTPASIHPLHYAGRSQGDKLADFRAFFDRNALDGYLVTDPGLVNWLFNLRGRDIVDVHSFNPVLLCRAFVAAEGQSLIFIDPAKITPEIADYLGADVHICKPDTLVTAVLDHPGKVIGLDPAHCPSSIERALQGADKDINYYACPLDLGRGIKNDIEIQGARAAQLRDAVAVLKTLHWIDSQADTTQLNEWDIAQHLTASRSKQDLYVDNSFAPLVGGGANSAIIHYYVSAATGQPLQNNTLLLIDSGGQYYDGTTDVTRTLVVGTPSPEMIADYTSVLQGHIALSRARFPHGTAGAALDALSRGPLWQRGRDFPHGVGHGIGSFAGVHEGPQRLSLNVTTPVQPGMLVTNEPGYYKQGAYGIRLENVELVVDVTRDGDDQPMLGLQSLTRIPFASKLIDVARLSADERMWLRAYHQSVLDDMLPLLNGDVQNWLREQCAPFSTL